MLIKQNYVLVFLMFWGYNVVQCTTTTPSNAVPCTPPLIPCGSRSCYNPTTQTCTGSSIIECINLCDRQCYNSATEICIDSTICRIGQGLCEVKYNTNGGLLSSSRLQCYDRSSQICLNHTICSYNSVCGQQCMPSPTGSPFYRYYICVDNTICTVSNPASYYQPNQIQLCDGSCYDTGNPPMKHCVNNTVQCISNCSNTCYDEATQVCYNGTICQKGQNACLIKFDVHWGHPLAQPQIACYNPINQVCQKDSICQKGRDVCEIDFDRSSGYPLARPETVCYDSLTEKCLNRARCSNARICNGSCITGYNSAYQVCANDQRTLCNVSQLYNNYIHYQIHLCKGQCYDTHFSQCVDGNVACIDKACNDQCYNSASHVCIGGSLCLIGQDLCIIKYNDNGFPTDSSTPQCFNPFSQRCLNHTLCSPDRICSEQCITGSNSNYQVCANDNRTLCNVPIPYYNYKPNQIQVCNGSCHDMEYPPMKHCVNGTVQCISECSGQCYNVTTQVCLNGILCRVGYNICLTDFDMDSGYPIVPRTQCYDPSWYICLNRSICSKDRTCNGRCITGVNSVYQVCANDRRTICNVTKHYSNYRPNQMQLCDGICYDSFLQQCHGQTVAPCIHDPNTQICIPENINGSTTIMHTSTSTASATSSTPLTNSSTTLDSNIFSTERAVESTSMGSTSSSVEPDTFSPSGNQTDSGVHTSDQNTSPSTDISQPITATSSSNSCSMEECSQDADCCVPRAECQCYHHTSNSSNGLCLNPFVTPICADGCPQKSVCSMDTDCCKCHCGIVTVSDKNGTTITSKRCVPR